MTEEQIERDAERQMDRLDARLMRNELTQAEYDRLVKDLDRSVETAYARRGREG